MDSSATITKQDASAKRGSPSRATHQPRNGRTPSAGELLTDIAAMIPRNVASQLDAFGEWVHFYARIVDQVFDLPPCAAKGPCAKADEIPEVDQVAETRAKIEVLHRFSEAEMQLIDPLLEEVPVRMRRHPDFVLFEGEEILASWVSREGRRIPSMVPSSGWRPEGGYLMHMANDARQRAHVHGVMHEDGLFAPETGARFLMGIFGARSSTIRTAHGIHRIPRGALATIHFPQTASGPTAHQFWNEDEGPGVGNVLFSFHGRDFEAGASAAGGSETMGRRTYHLGPKAIEGAPGHGFMTNIEGAAS